MKSIQNRLISDMATILFISTIIFSPTSLVIGQEVPPALDVGSDGVLF